MYSNYFAINKNFQSSVNLELDLYKNSKINEYIPTPDICDVLKRYLESILDDKGNRATTLVGPYGKGKSFILLTLSYIFSKEKDLITWNTFLKRVKVINNDLYRLLIRVEEEDVKLLTVLVNGIYQNVTQALQNGIFDALKRENLTNLIPKTNYSVCVEILKGWLKKEGLKDKVNKLCKEFFASTPAKIINGLSSFDPKAYNQFETLYKNLNYGLEFNSYAADDVHKIYTGVAQQLHEFGYKGMLVIFDEFSKFIEDSDGNLGKDLKIIQDLAEISTRSDSIHQINFCCVLHKSLSLYNNEKRNKSSLDTFKTIEGRFTEIKFNRSLEENYSIISNAIKKNKDSKEFINKRIKDNKEFYDEIDSLNLFDESRRQIVYKGCFPINPLTIFALIKLSEYVAQNERTLFTFLCDTDENSFSSFIHTNNDGYFNVNKIFDYFSSSFQKIEENSIRNIWYRAESTLTKLQDAKARIVIKTLSTILMINDFDKLPPTNKIISLGGYLSKNETNKIINELIENHFLRKNSLNGYLSFSLSNTKVIDDEVSIYKKTKFIDFKPSDELNIINPTPFLLPRKYNEENKITRFYKTIYLEESDYINISSFDYYFDENYCNGVVVYLLRRTLSDKQIVNKIRELNDKRVIVVYPKKCVDNLLDESLINYACLTEIVKKKNIDQLTIAEIELLQKEVLADIYKLNEIYFKEEFNFYSIILNKNETFNSLLSRTMENIYPVKLIFNNELINKKTVSTQYQKAINNVIDWMLDGNSEFKYSITSAENSIKYSVLDYNLDGFDRESSNNFRKLVDDFKNKITALPNEKIQVSRIISTYINPPYGIRQGVLPLIFAKAISETDVNFVFYFQEKEVSLDSATIVKSITSDKFFLKYSSRSKQQRAFVLKLMDLFEVSSTNDFRKDLILCAQELRRFFIGLPNIIRSTSLNNNFIDLDEEFIQYKNLFLGFDINPYSVVLEEPITIFKTNEYSIIFDYIERYKIDENSLLEDFKFNLIQRLKELFGVSQDTSLKVGINEFIESKLGETKPMLEERFNNFYNLIRSHISYNDNEALRQISKLVTKISIEDWTNDNTKDVLSFVTEFINFIEEKNDLTTQNKIDEDTFDISPLGSLLKNNIESVVEEFSDSVPLSEKIAILKNILKKLK